MVGVGYTVFKKPKWECLATLLCRRRRVANRTGASRRRAAWGSRPSMLSSKPSVRSKPPRQEPTPGPKDPSVGQAADMTTNLVSGGVKGDDAVSAVETSDAAIQALVNPSECRS